MGVAFVTVNAFVNQVGLSTWQVLKANMKHHCEMSVASLILCAARWLPDNPGVINSDCCKLFSTGQTEKMLWKMLRDDRNCPECCNCALRIRTASQWYFMLHCELQLSSWVLHLQCGTCYFHSNLPVPHAPMWRHTVPCVSVLCTATQC